jgi:hypothetical protein
MVDGSNMDQFPTLLPPSSSSSSSPLPPHVILVSTPLPGHSIPFLQAAKRLVDEGVTITYVSTDDHISQLLESSNAASRELRSRGVRFVKLRDGLKHPTGLDFHRYVHSLEGERNMIHLLEEVVVELLQSSHHLKQNGDASSVAAAALQQRSTPCCILYDMFSTWSQEVADNHKLAKHLLFVSGALTLCVFSQARFFFHRSSGPFFVAAISSVISCTRKNMKKCCLPQLWLFATIPRHYSSSTGLQNLSSLLQPLLSFLKQEIT